MIVLLLLVVLIFLTAINGHRTMALAAAFVFLAAFTFDLAGRALLYTMQADRAHPTAGSRTDS